jgi:hypothetical protein
VSPAPSPRCVPALSEHDVSMLNVVGTCRCHTREEGSGLWGIPLSCPLLTTQGPHPEAPYLFELPPGVGPSPEVGLVLAKSDCHQCVTTVIKYRPVGWEEGHDGAQAQGSWLGSRDSCAYKPGFSRYIMEMIMLGSDCKKSGLEGVAQW